MAGRGLATNWGASQEATGMAKAPSPCPNPRRVEAGRRNRARWRGLSDEGRERLRRAAMEHRPWEHATGPTTAEGKLRSAQNGRSRQKGPRSTREIRAE